MRKCLTRKKWTVPLKGVCHEIFSLYIFFHDSKPSGPLTNRLKYFCILFYFAEIFKFSRNSALSCTKPRSPNYFIISAKSKPNSKLIKLFIRGLNGFELWKNGGRKSRDMTHSFLSNTVDTRQYLHFLKISLINIR